MRHKLRPGSLFRSASFSKEPKLSQLALQEVSSSDVATGVETLDSIDHLNPFDHSRGLDVHTWSNHPEVNKFVREIGQEYFSDFSHKRCRQQLKVVLLDLYVAWIDDPDLKISYSRDVNRYRVKSRYNALKISKLTPQLVDRLEKVGLVSQQLGFYDRRLGVRVVISICTLWPRRYWAVS